MTKIHATAVVDAGAELAEDVQVGPYCVIGPNVKVGKGTKLDSHVVVDGWTTIGSGSHIFPFACIGTQTQDLKFKGAKTFVQIGNNTTLREYVTVNSGTNEGEITKVGNGCHIMAYCHVAHACNVGNNVIMANCATLAGEVTIEDDVGIGGIAGIHQFVRIGKMCFIGGMSRISQDCPPFMIISGIPPEVPGINSVGLTRKGVSAEVQATLKEVHRLLYRQGLSTRQALEKIHAEIPFNSEVEHLVKFIETSERGIVK